MIESTLRFDDVEDIPGLLPLLRAVQRSRMRSRERSGRRPGNEASPVQSLSIVRDRRTWIMNFGTPVSHPHGSIGFIMTCNGFKVKKLITGSQMIEEQVY